MGQVRWLQRIATLGAPSAWYSSSGNMGPRVRYTEDGRIEVEGKGIIRTNKFPVGVNAWKDLIWKYSKQYNLRPHFVAGIMGLESGGIQKAGSPAGAQGLMQLMPSTASIQAGRTVSADELKNDPELNIQLGCKYIRYQTDRYKDNPIDISAAYNAGTAIAGSACRIRTVPGDKKSPCLERCPPNQWNLVTDCYPIDKNDLSKGYYSVDYPTIVFAIANVAWEGEFGPGKDAASITCPSGQHVENGQCVPDAPAPPDQSCPQGFQSDGQGGCIPIPIAEGCPEGYTPDGAGGCKPVNPPVVTASASTDMTPLLLLAGAAALGYLFLKDKKVFQ